MRVLEATADVTESGVVLRNQFERTMLDVCVLRTKPHLTKSPGGCLAQICLTGTVGVQKLRGPVKPEARVGSYFRFNAEYVINNKYMPISTLTRYMWTTRQILMGPIGGVNV